MSLFQTLPQCGNHHTILQKSLYALSTFIAPSIKTNNEPIPKQTPHRNARTTKIRSENMLSAKSHSPGIRQVPMHLSECHNLNLDSCRYKTFFYWSTIQRRCSLHHSRPRQSLMGVMRGLLAASCPWNPNPVTSRWIILSLTSIPDWNRKSSATAKSLWLFLTARLSVLQ